MIMLEIREPNISLVEEKEKDKKFVKDLYGESREEELSRTSWTEDIRSRFIDMQFEAQYIHYRQNYTGANFWLIVFRNKKVGRLYYHENYEGGIRIIDIVIQKEYQKRGIGTEILTAILDRARVIDKKVSIHVESFNPAMIWYKKLGFEFKSETNGVYHLFEWKAKS